MRDCERLDAPVALPKLYSVTLNELLRTLFGGRFVFASQINSELNVPVLVEQIGAVIWHSWCIPAG